MKKILLVLAFVFSCSSHASLINSGSIEIPGTFSFDFESGSFTGIFGNGADIFWDQLTATERNLSTRFQTSTMASLGLVNFASIAEADLLGLVFSLNEIQGPPGGSLLDINSVFAVLTAEGNYVKAIVTGYNPGTANRDFYNILISYEVFDGVMVPEPESMALLFLCLSALLFRRRLQK